ncbi:MAG: hypothetical protein CSA66_03290 [Proteobacteria bacterium]|nr:MAG: hypothetical protein CSA66_03290 [Pseudomonadota bacterium]
MTRTLLALIVTLLALSPPALAQTNSDAGSTGDAIGGTHVGEIKDEIIEDRFSCEGGAASGLTPFGGALLVLGAAAWRRR